MGLSLCSTIIRSHGGEFWLDESFTNGARFVFTLPCENEKEGAAVNQRILIIDDDAAVCSSLASVLATHGFEATSFTTARSAIEQLPRDRMRLRVA